MDTHMLIGVDFILFLNLFLKSFYKDRFLETLEKYLVWTFDENCVVFKHRVNLVTSPMIYPTFLLSLLYFNVILSFSVYQLLHHS